MQIFDKCSFLLGSGREWLIVYFDKTIVQILKNSFSTWNKFFSQLAKINLWKTTSKMLSTISSRLEVAQFLKYQMQIFKNSCFFFFFFFALQFPYFSIFFCFRWLVKELVIKIAGDELKKTNLLFLSK